MKNSTISVIIACFNGEKTIVDCLRSVVSQTYSEIEIIVVDDGSTDSSTSLIKNEAIKDSRIKLFQISHGGQSKARNYGISKSCGNLLFFLDSDDILSLDCLEILLANLKVNNCDISMGNYLFGVDRTFKTSNNKILFCGNGKKCLVNFNPRVMVWNNLYKRSLFDDLSFNGILYEDEDIYYKLIYKAKRICITSKYTYYYYFDKNSISKKETNYLNDSFISIIEHRKDYFKDAGEKELYEKTCEHFVMTLIVFYIRCFKNKDNKNDKSHYYKLIKSNYNELKKSKSVNFLNKIKIHFFLVFPKATSRIAIKLKLNSRFL